MRPVDADGIIKKQRDLIRRTCDEVYANDWHNPVILAMSSVAGIVLDAPTISLEPIKHGKWVSINGYYDAHKCSVCETWAEGWTNYCTYCGAKMDLQEEQFKFPIIYRGTKRDLDRKPKDSIQEGAILLVEDRVFIFYKGKWTESDLWQTESRSQECVDKLTYKEAKSE